MVTSGPVVAAVPVAPAGSAVALGLLVAVSAARATVGLRAGTPVWLGRGLACRVTAMRGVALRAGVGEAGCPAMAE